MFRYAYLHLLKTNYDEYYIFSVIFWSMLHVAFQNKRDVIHYEKFIYCAVYTPAYARLQY
jgi:hypothetical protein